MAFKFVCLAALLAVAKAGNLVAPIAYTANVGAPLLRAAPLAALPVAKTVVDTQYDPHPQYNYAYNIQDAITGDNKGHQEIRDGDVVQGRYFLIDADGSRRTVEYTADPINGFNAVVHREPLVKAIAAAPVVAAAPIIAAKYAAPVARYAYTAPAAYAQPAPLAYAARFAAPVAAPLAYAPIAKTIIH